MKYLVGQLARLARITPRTLHYYDEIGLLEPEEIGENGYRSYGEAAILRLQQILFYRELGISLEEIKRILESPDFSPLTALEDHREELKKKIERLDRLVRVVEDTILHLKGKKTMQNENFFKAFSEEQQEAYALEAEKLYDPEIVRASNQRWKAYPQAEKDRILAEGRQVYLDFVTALEKGPASLEAQACVDRWRKHMEAFWTPTLEQLVFLAEGYNTDPRFKNNFDKIHPRLASFVLEAVRVYVDSKK